MEPLKTLSVSGVVMVISWVAWLLRPGQAIRHSGLGSPDYRHAETLRTSQIEAVSL